MCGVEVVGVDVGVGVMMVIVLFCLMELVGLRISVFVVFRLEMIFIVWL